MSDVDESIDRTDEAPAPRGLSRGRIRIRRLGRFLALIVLAGIVAAVLLLQTGRGQEVLLNGLLDRVRGGLAGELAIGSVRSGTLLTGATLVDVQLTAEGGRNFLRADSLEIGYSVLALFTGTPRVRSLVAHGLNVEISRYGGEEQLNVLRLVRPVEALDVVSDSVASAPEGRRFELDRLSVVGGQVEFLTPLPLGAPAARAVASPDGEGDLRRLAFSDLDFEVADARIFLGGGDTLFAGDLREFASTAEILREPFQITRIRGDFSLGRVGIALEGGEFRLPGSRLEGELSVGPPAPGDPWVFSTSLETRAESDLEDLRWIDERIPTGGYSGAASVRVDGGVEVALRSFAVDAPGSDLVFDGDVRFRNEMVLDGMEVEASPLAFEFIEPWLGRDIPADGFVRGRSTFDGTLRDLAAVGRMTVVVADHPGEPTTVDFSGTVHQGENPGATDLVATFSPLNYSLLDLAFPAIPLPGTGNAALEVTGRVDDGISVRLDALHRDADLPVSTVRGEGTFQRQLDGSWLLDLTGDLDPFAIGLLAGARPDLELGGVIRGPITARGRLRDLAVTGDLETEEGRFALDGVIDARRIGSFYRLDIEGRGVSLSRFSTRLPEPSEWNGLLSIEGRGLAPDSMDATATMNWTASRIGGLLIDTVSANLRASQGILTFDSLSAVLGKVGVQGDGRLGIVAPLDGEARLAFQTDSLIGLRPLFLGDSVTAKDTLSLLERDFLRLQGVDVDALPDSIDVRMHGSMSGTVRLVGSVDALDVDLNMEMRNAAYGPNAVDSATLALVADDLPSLDGDWDVLLDAHGVVWEGRGYRLARFDGEMDAREGQASFTVERGPGERLDASGAFAFDSLGTRVDVASANLLLDSLEYTLGGPARVSWSRNVLAFEDVSISRTDQDPMSLTAEGTLSREGVSDFTLVAEGLHLGRLVRLAEVDGWDVAGHTDARLRITGPAAAPVIEGSISIEEPRLGEIQLERVAGDLSYRGRTATLGLDAWRGEDLVFSVAGEVPYDLALADVDDRSVAREMDLRVTADSLDAAVALAYFSDLEDVAGLVSADVVVGGTTERPEPDGLVTLDGGGWSIEAIGVRHTEVSGTLTLRPDRTVDVSLATEATGTSRVSGTVVIDPIYDPALDLRIAFADFQAVDRIDIEGRISGDLTLVGRYSRPVIAGNLTVDRGTLFVDEFARTATVVDLLDPALFADTTAFMAQPLLRDIRNPFLERLQVTVELDVPRDTWLRSDEMAVEIGGQDLSLLYDRRAGDIVLIGELQALRGSYRILQRTFNVSEGSVAFLGFPGINPTLDIEAQTRVRRLNDQPPLNVVANVTGTLTLPEVNLSTDEAGLAQADLVSYLLLGRASSELASGQQAFLNNAFGTGFTVATGAVVAQLGSALAQGIGIDYLSITQAGDLGFARTSLAAFADTQVELGQYLGPDAFLVVVFRPLSNQAPGAGLNLFGGARLEWSLSDEYTFEGFVEDRFLRSRTATFGDLGEQGNILGVFIFREWGY